MIGLQLYSKAKIKPGAWVRFLKENGLDINKQIPPPQTILAMPIHTPYHDRVMLSFPFYWWHETDLEPYQK